MRNPRAAAGASDRLADLDEASTRKAPDTQPKRPKPQFAALPNRALWDRRLTDRDVRNLAVVAAHDRLSSATGKGQGAWASHARFAALAGTEYSRFSVSINKLLKLGYLDRQPLATDKRKFTYRVLYTDADSLPSSKEPLPEIVCGEANGAGEIVCSNPQLSGCIINESVTQYISQSEEINSLERGKRNSPEVARFAARLLPKIEFGDNSGAQMARLERSLSVGEVVDHLAWYQWLENQIEDENPNNSGRASRLADSIVERMDADEYRALGEEHGWVDDEGKWDEPSPRSIATDEAA